MFYISTVFWASLYHSLVALAVLSLFDVLCRHLAFVVGISPLFDVMP
jgi:hypothetical protein